MTPEEVKAKVDAKMASQSIPRLLEMWKITNEITDGEISTVRGWIMDELERRAPKAFALWMEADGAPEPGSFFRE